MKSVEITNQYCRITIASKLLLLTMLPLTWAVYSKDAYKTATYTRFL